MKCGIDVELEKLLAEYDINPKEFVLEVTETAFVDNVNYYRLLIGVRN